MTRYEQGFLTKCAEYGVDVDTAVDLMQKRAAPGGGAASRVGSMLARLGTRLAQEGFKPTVHAGAKAARRQGTRLLNRYTQLLLGGSSARLNSRNAAKVSRELDKVLATRAGTVAAGGLGLYGLSQLGDD